MNIAQVLQIYSRYSSTTEDLITIFTICTSAQRIFLFICVSLIRVNSSPLRFNLVKPLPRSPPLDDVSGQSVTSQSSARIHGCYVQFQPSRRVTATTEPAYIFNAKSWYARTQYSEFLSLALGGAVRIRGLAV